MIQLAANLTMLFPELPFTDRFAAARAAGFTAVEFLFPYQWPAEQLHEKIKQSGVKQVLFNLPPGDWDKGERGLACLPGRQDEFQESVGRAIEYAKVLETPRMHCMAGVIPEGAQAEALQETYVENLKFAARACERENIGILIEPINPFDVPGYFLNYSNQALDILQRASHPNLKLQYDLYHMHRIGDDMPSFIAKNIGHIAHFQVAGHPGRHEPDCGEVPYSAAFDAINAQDYAGWIGCEYIPESTTLAGLTWAEHWLNT
ncbi:MAG: 2-oxo-tetronate isomerase [Hyphomicrobiales bacterium]